MAKYKVGYFVGSLSSTSINRELSEVLIRLAPEDLEFTEIPIRDLPLYSQDHDADYPPVARAFKKAIADVDGVLFVTPEFNRSIPGGLKNAIDWASRPYGDNVWDGKPVGIMGASIGMLGTARAQYHLRQMFVFLNMFPLNQPEVMIAQAAEKFDHEGNLKDQITTQKIRELLETLTEWTKSLQKSKTLG